MALRSGDKDEIRERARGLGADLVGFLSLRDYHSPNSPDPRNWLTDSRSLVILVFRHLYGAFDTDAWSHMHSYMYAPEATAIRAGYILAKSLEDGYGGRTFMVPLHRPFEMDEDSYRMPRGMVSLRHAAVQSGLAVWGRNTLALTPQYGPRQWFMGLLTSLDVETDAPTVGDYNPCQTCSFPCVDACPGNAFTEDGKTISHRCVRNSQGHDPGHLMRFLVELLDQPGNEERKAMLRSASFINKLQNLHGYLNYGCTHCTRACPPLGQRSL